MSDNNFLNMVEEIEEERNLETPSSGSNSSWTPTTRINPNDSGYQYPEKSSMFNIEKYNGVPLAASRRFGIVKPGDGLIILKDGILSLNVGSGFTIDETTKKIVFDSSIVFAAGNNISIQEEASGVITINSSYVNTTYTGGTGLTLSDTTFSVDYGTTAGTATPQGPATEWRPDRAGRTTRAGRDSSTQAQ